MTATQSASPANAKPVVQVTPAAIAELKHLAASEGQEKEGNGGDGRA